MIHRLVTRWITPLPLPRCAWLSLGYDEVTSMAHSREIRFWKKTVRKSLTGSLIQLYSAVCAGSTLPLSWQCCLSLYTRGNCTTIKGNKAEKEAVCPVSADRKKFPAAGAGRRVVKLLSIMASVSVFWEALHFYFTTAQRGNVQMNLFAPLS